MKTISGVLVGAIAFLFVDVSDSHSAIIPVSSISGEWTNVVGGADVTNNGAQTNPTAAQLRWGGIIANNPLSAQSGYDFLSAAPPPFNVVDGVPFVVGTFTHFNNPIASGTGISSAELRVFANIGGVGNTGPFRFFFDHTETPNSCDPAPACADDIVAITNLTTSESFEIGDQLYTLHILGFSTDGGNTISNLFSSPEGGMNSANLYAKFVAPVPLPAAIWMFLSAMACLFGGNLLRWNRTEKNV